MPTSDTVSRQDVAHLLRRTGFGGSDAELTALTNMTRAQCINIVMGFASADATPGGQNVGVPGFVNDDSQWQAHSAALDWWFQRMADMANPTAVPAPVPATAAALPLREKMTIFWHGHFACAQDKVDDFPAMWDQMGLFRRKGLGNFDTLVRETSIHPAMLVNLDNATNIAGAEQENFARELMELHTCGVGNYTEQDVVAMARAWTGHNIVGWTGSDIDTSYDYNPEYHDNANKEMFGITARWNGIKVNGSDRDTITELVYGVKQQATARFIARKLFRYFVHLDPSDSQVNALGQIFIAGGMEIAPLVRAILEHDEFWGTSARHALVKSPVEFVVSLIRRSGLPADQMGLRWSMTPMGQTLFDPPSVAGWGEGEHWLDTAAAWGRGGFAGNQRWRASEAGLLAGLDDSADDDAAADAIFALFGLEEISSRTREAVKRWHRNAYGSSSTRWSTVPQGFLLGALCPEFHVY